MRRLKHAVTGSGDQPGELVDGVGGPEHKTEVDKSSGSRPVDRTFVAGERLEQLQTDAAEIQQAAAKTGIGVRTRRRGHRTELQVEIAESLDIVGRQRDELYLSDLRVPKTRSAYIRPRLCTRG